MSKPIYKATKPYTEDINDLIEKGGVGSGKRGHKTAGPLSNSGLKQDPNKAKLMNKLVLADMNGGGASDQAYAKAAKALGTTPEKLKSQVKRISSAQQNKTYDGPGRSSSGGSIE